jgi:hypothetical protein
MGDERAEDFLRIRRLRLGLPVAPFQAHSTTSIAAAGRIGKHLGPLRLAVLEFLRGAGAHGATDDEMQVALGMNPSTQRPRRIELAAMGLVTESGARRKTRSGRQAAVWVAQPPNAYCRGP